jgi:ketosteroid isomerase-like protein
LYGPFFQFVDVEADREAGVERRGRSFMGSRSASIQSTELQQHIEDVNVQINQLLQQRDLAQSRLVNARMHAVGHAMEVATRFYEMFSHGYDPVNHPTKSQAAETFLRAVMRNDAVCTEFKGVDLFLRQYEVATLHHAGLMVTLKQVTLIDSGDDSIQVKAETTAHFRINRVALQKFFPSIIQDEQLVQQLIGKEYQMQYDKVYHFANGRIFQHESRADMCSGLLQMVGDPFLALKLVEASLMTKHGHWKISSDIVEDKHELKNSAM